MQSMPLFPLKAVLFPRMPLVLNVFEERYKRMVSHCLKDERPFGVVLIKNGVEVGGPAEPESVGTIARIHAIEPLEDGQLTLFTEGTSRFQIHSIDPSAEPYLIGSIELVQDEPSDQAGIQPLADRARALFSEYFDILVHYAGVDMPGYDLPDSAEELSFVMAAVVQADTAQRQSFLEMTDTSARLERLHTLLVSDIERLRLAAERTDRNGFVAQQLPAAWKEKFISRN